MILGCHTLYVHQLEALEADASAQLRAARRLATDIAEPTASEVLEIVARDAERDCALVRRLLAGALDALRFSVSGAPRLSETAIAEISSLAQATRSHGRGLHALARSERDRDHAPIAILLQAAADNSDTRAHLLVELGRYLETRSAFPVETSERVANMAAGSAALDRRV